MTPDSSSSSSDTARDKVKAAPRVRLEPGQPIRVELISIGGDLTRGRVVNHSARKIAAALSTRGARVGRITTISDQPTGIASALREALERAPHMVITTGGLGPAADDHTLQAVSDALSRPLNLNPAARTMVEACYESMAKSKLVPSGGINRAREKLCRIPVGSQPIANPQGLTVGVVCRLPGGAAVICLPGRTEEALEMLEPALERVPELVPRGHVAQRDIEAPTADEAALRPLLERVAEEFPDVWVTSLPARSMKKGAVAMVSLEATGATSEEAVSRVSAAQARLLSLAGGAL